ncbi:MAG: hypothetical protein IJX78_07445 [Bacilli bacterium]|nr:hypothetical protein [Bacilli bacterium]
MEKSNELNKFLSYIHMGMSIYRIYYEQSERFNDNELIKLIVEIEEIFKTHEEKTTRIINELGETATNSLTAAGIMGVYKERLKIFEEPFDICISALKSTNMGLISAIKFLNDNQELPDKTKTLIQDVIKDYQNIQEKWLNYIFMNIGCC